MKEMYLETLDKVDELQAMVIHYTRKTGYTGNFGAQQWIRKNGNEIHIKERWEVWLEGNNTSRHLICDATIDECIEWMKGKLDALNND